MVDGFKYIDPQEISRFLSTTRAFTKEMKDWKGRKRPKNYSKDSEIKEWTKDIERLRKFDDKESKNTIEKLTNWIHYKNQDLESEQLLAENRTKETQEYCIFCEGYFQVGHLQNDECPSILYF